MANPFSRAAKPEEAGAPDAAPKKAAKPAFTLKPSKQTCILLGALSGVVLSASIGLFVWQSSEVAQIEAQVRQKNDEVTNGNKIATNLAAVEKDYNDMQGQLRYLETSVSPGEYVPTLLKQMERLAKQMDLNVQSVRPSLEPAPDPPTDKEARKKFVPWPYDKLHVDMDISGEYWKVARLLYRFTTFEKIIAVENVQLSPIQTEDKYTQRLSTKLRVTGFIFKADEEAAKPADDKTAKPEAKTAQKVDDQRSVTKGA